MGVAWEADHELSGFQLHCLRRGGEDVALRSLYLSHDVRAGFQICNQDGAVPVLDGLDDAVLCPGGDDKAGGQVLHRLVVKAGWVREGDLTLAGAKAAPATVAAGTEAGSKE